MYMYKVQSIGSWGPPISCKFRSGSTCIIKLLNLKISLTQCSVALNALTFDISLIVQWFFIFQTKYQEASSQSLWKLTELWNIRTGNQRPSTRTSCWRRRTMYGRWSVIVSGFRTDSDHKNTDWYYRQIGTAASCIESGPLGF